MLCFFNKAGSDNRRKKIFGKEKGESDGEGVVLLVLSRMTLADANSWRDTGRILWQIVQKFSLLVTLQPIYVFDPYGIQCRESFAPTAFFELHLDCFVSQCHNIAPKKHRRCIQISQFVRPLCDVTKLIFVNLVVDRWLAL